jgi:hypothetical protein
MVPAHLPATQAACHSLSRAMFGKIDVNGPFAAHENGTMAQNGRVEPQILPISSRNLIFLNGPASQATQMPS